MGLAASLTIGLFVAVMARASLKTDMVTKVTLRHDLVQT